MAAPKVACDFGKSVNNEELFDSGVISDLNIEVPIGLIVRPLSVNDYSKGFLGVLGQLTSVGHITFEQYEARFRSMQNNLPKAYFVLVVEDSATGKVVGAATLVLEWKFIHEAGCRGRVEDVVVDETMRGKKLGALLNRFLAALAKKVGCYKLSLECKDSLIPFYELFGYKKDAGNNFLVQRFDEKVQEEIRIPSNL